MMKALAGPYTNISFIPTGGINASNVREYLKWDRIVACGGSWMVNQKMLNTGNFEATKTSMRLLDAHVRQIIDTAKTCDYAVMLTADHGNAEEMLNADGSPQKYRRN